MSQTLNTNNVFVGKISPSNPKVGQIFHDTDNGETNAWNGSDWIMLPAGVPVDTSANFRIFVANDISYAKITLNVWWMDNYPEIHQWLSENNAGYYIEDLNAISFFDHKFATAFQLKWG